MKIISKYVLREHVGPLAFALTALTSLMLLNFIAKQFGDLVGKGLPTARIVEFFLLAIPFTVAMTLPMAVLVSVLYAFSRLASENEVTAFKASGVSMWRLMTPALGMGVVMTLGMLAFNDQVLPRANFRLANLQRDIIRTRPTFALKEQVINTLQEGRLYLRAGKIERGSGQMREVVMYDLTNPTRRRTIYADSGTIEIAPNRRDVHMTLYHGVMQEVPSDQPAQLTRLYYLRDRIRVAGVAGGNFEESNQDVGKGDREMSVCEMQEAKRGYETRLAEARADSLRTAAEARGQDSTIARRQRRTPPPARGLGAAYCELLERLRPGVKEARAAELPRQAPQPRAEQQPLPLPVPQPVRQTPLPQRLERGMASPGRQRAEAMDSLERVRRAAAMDSIQRAHTAVYQPLAEGTMPKEVYDQRLRDARERMADARAGRDRYEVEIQKKFSLAAACLIFVLLGAPLALRFPRGGVGLVIGISLVIFAVYYVGLIGGETLADKGYLSPFWAMWAVNLVLLAAGLLLALRMGYEANSGRGGGIGEWLAEWRARRASRGAARLIASARPALAAAAERREPVAESRS